MIGKDHSRFCGGILPFRTDRCGSIGRLGRTTALESEKAAAAQPHCLLVLPLELVNKVATILFFWWAGSNTAA